MLLALAWPNHQFHDASRAWLKRDGKRGWWTCALTELGFVRLSCNPAFTSHPRTPAEAVALLKLLTAHAHHRFLEELAPVSSLLPSDRMVGHQQVTDGYLLALAARRRLNLATFDNRLRALGSPQRVLLIEPS